MAARSALERRDNGSVLPAVLVKRESVGPDFKAAVEAMQRRQATLDAVGSGVAVKPDGDHQSQTDRG